jgi:hypothetical protein
MGTKPTPSKEMLDALLDYQTKTGTLFWKQRPLEMFADNDGGHSRRHNRDKWNAKFAGKEAFTAVKGDGYKHGALFGEHFSAHRIIWKMMTGQEAEEIDHINGVRSDNRWDNLRSVPRSVNMRNAAKGRDNKSGVTGVRRSNRGTWQAFITVDYKMICLGSSKNFDEAVKMRKDAEEKYGFHSNHGRTNPAA